MSHAGRCGVPHGHARDLAVRGGAGRAEPFSEEHTGTLNVCGESVGSITVFNGLGVADQPVKISWKETRPGYRLWPR